MSTYQYFGGGLTVREELINPLEGLSENYLSGLNYDGQSLEFVSINQIVGLSGTVDGQTLICSSFYNDLGYLPGQSGASILVWKSALAKSNHNGTNIFSPTVDWDGSHDTLSSYYAGVGETDPSGLGCWVRACDELTVEMGGAVGDKTTDDSVVFNQVCSVVGSSGGGIVKAYGHYLIDDNVTVPDYVSLVGPHRNPEHIRPTATADYNAKDGQLIVNPAKTITTGDGASVSGFLVMRKGLSLPFANATDAANGIAAFDGTPFTVGGQGGAFANMLILGFEYAIYSTGYERIKCDYILGDCTNGIKIQNSADICYLNKCHFWPFTTAQQSYTSANPNLVVRDGTAFEYSNIGDWSKLTDCFNFGYLIGVDILDCNHVSLSGVGCDYRDAYASASIGIRIRGTSHEAELLNCQTSGRNIGVLIDSTSTLRMAARINSISTWNIDTYHIHVARGRVVISGPSAIAHSEVNTSIGIQIDAASDGAVIDDVDFAKINTPIAGSGAGWAKTKIGKRNRYTQCTPTTGWIDSFLSSSQPRTWEILSVSSSGTGFKLQSKYSRGSVDVPVISSSNDNPLNIAGAIHDGTNYFDCASIVFGGSGAPALGSTPGQLTFGTTQSGSTSVTYWTRLSSAGHFFPVTNNVSTLGASANRWSNTYTVDLDVSGGAVIGAATGGDQGDGTVNTSGNHYINGTQVIASRKTGWTADTGTAKRTANATYSGTAEGAYTQATIQALMDVVKDQSQTIKALKDDLIAHGLIGS